MKSSPVFDPVRGIIWAASHGGSLFALRLIVTSRGKEETVKENENRDNSCRFQCLGVLACESSVFSTPLLLSDGRVLVCSLSGSVFAIDPPLLPPQPDTVPPSSHPSTPLHPPASLKSKESHSPTLNVHWRSHLGSPIFSSPIEWCGVLIVCDASGSIFGLSAVSGETFWTLKLSKSIFSSPATLTDRVSGVSLPSTPPPLILPVSHLHKSSRLFVGCHDSSIYCLVPPPPPPTLSTLPPSISWKFEMQSPIFSSPFTFRLFSPRDPSLPLIDAVVVADTKGDLCLLEAVSGLPLARTKVGSDRGEVFSSCVVVNEGNGGMDNGGRGSGAVWIGCRDDNLYKYVIEIKKDEKDEGE